MQQPHQFSEVEMRRQQVLAPEIEHSAVPCLAVLPKRFDHTHILVRDAFAAGGADHTQEHGLLRNLSLRSRPLESADRNQKNPKEITASVPTVLAKLKADLSNIKYLKINLRAARGNMR